MSPPPNVHGHIFFGWRVSANTRGCPIPAVVHFPELISNWRCEEVPAERSANVLGMVRDDLASTTSGSRCREPHDSVSSFGIYHVRDFRASHVAVPHAVQFCNTNCIHSSLIIHPKTFGSFVDSDARLARSDPSIGFVRNDRI